MKDVADRRLIFVLAFLLTTMLSHESEASRRVAVRKGGVAVVKCQFPGERNGVESKLISDNSAKKSQAAPLLFYISLFLFCYLCPFAYFPKNASEPKKKSTKAKRNFFSYMHPA